MISKAKYTDFLEKEDSVLSLDISKTNTGWVKKIGGKVTYGDFSLEGSTNREIRNKFKDEILKIVPNEGLDLCIIENTIMGSNYTTTKILTELNVLVEELIDFGLIKIKKVQRIDNKTWKKNLRKAANYSNIEQIKSLKDKEIITKSLEELEFDTSKVSQDIQDAMGMLIGFIYEKHLSTATSTSRKLKTNIEKGFRIKQYWVEEELEEKALAASKRYGKPIHKTVFTKDITSEFKKHIEEIGDDTGIHQITCKTRALGVLAIKYVLDVREDEVHLLVINTKNKTKK